MSRVARRCARRRFQRVDRLFNKVVDLPREQRRAFLDEIAVEDPELHAEVERLLAADAATKPFLERPLAQRWGTSFPSRGTPSPRGDQELPERVGRIRLEEQLGVGGMGQVFRGFDEKLERPVAVKVLHHERRRLDRQRVRALLHEAQLLSQLRHPGICQIYDYIEDEERDYLVLELVEGYTLKKRMRQGIVEADALRYAEQIAETLAAAHARGVVHRDLKPENVMVTPNDELKVLDFGVARMVEPEGGEEPADTGESVSVAMGTPRYMSPEQVLGEKATPASDMFSFGLLLQELLTGRPAFRSGLAMHDLLRDVSLARTEPRDGLSPELEKLCARLLSPAPATRPAAVDVIERLRFIRTAPRRRLRRRLAFLSVAALLAVAAIMTGLAVRLSQALSEADQQARVAAAQRLTAQAELRLDDHLDLALLLALEAYRTADILETRSNLLAAVEASPRLRTFLRAGHLQYFSVAWDPSFRFLASGGDDGNLRLWDVAARQLALPPIAAHREGRHSIWSLAWHAGTDRLASAGSRFRIRLWKVERAAAADGPAPILRILPERAFEGHRGEIWNVAWTSDGQRLASASDDGTVRIWTVPPPLNPPEGTMPPPAGTTDPDPVIFTFPNAVWDVTWSPDDQQLAVAGPDGKIYFVDVASGRVLAEIDAHGAAIWSLAWSPDGRLVASASEDHSIGIWDAATHLPTRSPLGIRGDAVISLAWSRDNRLAAGTQSGPVHIWDPRVGRFEGQPLHGHAGTVSKVVWTGDGRLASVSEDSTVVLWDPRPGGPGMPMLGHTNSITVLKLSPDGRILASGGLDMGLRLWDPATGRPLGEPLVGHEGSINYLSWSPDGRLLASSGEYRTVFIWDPSEQREVRRLHTDPGPVAVAWHPDDERLGVASRQGEISVWNARTGAPGKRRTVSGPLGDAVWSPDGRILSVGTRTDRIYIWDVGADVLHEWPAPEGTAFHVAWSRDGATLASAGVAFDVQLWDAASGRIAASLSGHTNRVRDLTWSVDGRFLASSSSDGSTIVWDVDRRAPMARISGHRASIGSAAWSLDGHRLFTAGMDGLILVHDLEGGPESWGSEACRRAGRNLSLGEWRRYISADLPYRRTCLELPPGEGAPGPL